MYFSFLQLSVQKISMKRQALFKAKLMINILVLFVNTEILHIKSYTVEPQWLEHLWDHGNLIETQIV